MAEYTFLIRRALADDVVAELPFKGVSYGFALNGYGSFAAQVSMDDRDNGFDPVFFTRPGRYVVCVERDGVLEWAGPLWSRSIDTSSRIITVGGNEFVSYLDRVPIIGDLAWVTQSINVIVYDLIAYAQSFGFSSDMHLVSDADVGGFAYVAIKGSEHPTPYEVMKHLSDEADDGSGFTGFDFRTEVSYDGLGGLSRVIRSGNSGGTPIGLPIGSGSRVVLDAFAPGGGGNVSSYTSDEQADPVAVYGFTAGNEGTGSLYGLGFALPYDDLIRVALAFNVSDIDPIDELYRLPGFVAAKFEAFQTPFAHHRLVNAQIVEGRGITDTVDVSRANGAAYGRPQVGDHVELVTQEGATPISDPFRVSAINVTVGDDSTARASLTLVPGNEWR